MKCKQTFVVALAERKYFQVLVYFDANVVLAGNHCLVRYYGASVGNDAEKPVLFHFNFQKPGITQRLPLNHSYVLDIGEQFLSLSGICNLFNYFKRVLNRFVVKKQVDVIKGVVPNYSASAITHT